MSFKQDASNRFRPFRQGDFMPQSRIRQGDVGAGGDEPSGTVDLGVNSNTLYTNNQFPLISNCKVESRTSNSFTEIARFDCFIPNTDRELLLFNLYAEKDGTGTWEFRVTSSQGSYTSGVLSDLSPTWHQLEVDVTRNTVEEIILEVRYVVDAYAVRKLAVYATLDAYTTTDLPTTGVTYNQFHPIATEQTGEQSPLNVHTVRKLCENNEFMHEKQFHGTAASFHGGYQNINNTEWQSFFDWVYWPREGVRYLHVHIHGFTNGWLGGEDGAQLRVGIRGHGGWFFDTQLTSSSVEDHADYGFAMPNRPGPVFIYVDGRDAQVSGRNGRIQHITLREIY